MSGDLRVLLVGHCMPDGYALKSAVRRALGDPVIVLVNDDGELRKQMPGARLVLVNRVLDGEFPDADGVELIRRIAPMGARAMLISNFPEAQEGAAAAGGLRGFGKSAMNSEATASALRAAVADVGAGRA